MNSNDAIEQLYATIMARKEASAESSYVANLFAKGVPHIAKKIGEEATETAMAAALNNPAQTIYESVDLLFHLCVLWAKMGITPTQIWAELFARAGVSGLEEKRNRNESPSDRKIFMSVDNAALATLFTDARTHYYWQNRPVDDALLMAAYDLAKMAPTSANCQPMRIVFVKSEAAKAKLKPALAAANQDKTMSAPVCAIIGMDMEFYNHLPELFPHADAKSWFVGNELMIEDTAFRNSSMQAGYFILAARALGLDCGPMSGFDNKAVDGAFFDGTAIKSNLLINLGYGDKTKLYPRSPRPAFADFCEIV